MSSIAAGTARPAPNRDALIAVGFGVGAVVFGAMVATRPILAVGIPVLLGAAMLAWWAPAANFTLLVFLTAIVPYGIQNSYDIGGGAGSPGLLASDIVLLLGMVRAVVSLSDMVLDRRAKIAIAALVGFAVLGGLQAVHGYLEGRSLSEIGAEYRVFVVLVGAALMALPLLLDPGGRRNLMRGMLFLGLLLGLWAGIQWTVDIPFAAAGDAGVREGILQTTEGRGQIQGGLFSFPVATILAAAALISGGIRSRLGVAAAVVVLLLNLGGLLLTYERTFWVTTALGLLLVIAMSTGRARLRALIWVPLALVAFFAVMSTIAPETLGAARERLLSLGRYQSDNSLRYRLVESRHVIDEIEKAPVFGSGLAAEIYWGRAWEQVPPESHTFAHNGYLWVTWKAGLVGALLLFGALLFVLIGRAPPEPSPLLRTLRTGAKAALLALLLSSVTFPSFTQLSSAAVIGMLAAWAVAPLTTARRRSA
ncbi:MAG TPA: O-antigen ligase family protein [Thermoleophilaceae bacterium]|nr:O-antigen ligase family protein [Thermoleophilaceae bacterium]